MWAPNKNAMLKQTVRSLNEKVHTVGSTNLVHRIACSHECCAAANEAVGHLIHVRLVAGVFVFSVLFFCSEFVSTLFMLSISLLALSHPALSYLQLLSHTQCHKNNSFQHDRPQNLQHHVSFTTDNTPDSMGYFFSLERAAATESHGITRTHIHTASQPQCNKQQ